MKTFLKEIFPPFILRVYRKIKAHKWLVLGFGNWEEASAHSSGYDSELVHDAVLKSALEVKAGNALFERDSKLFYEQSFDWPLIASILAAALKLNGSLKVMDFGGSLGSSYFRNLKFLKLIDSIDWCIIEQPEFVKSGIKFFEDENLHFFDSIESCISKYTPNLIILSSVLQYLDDPASVLNQIKEIESEYILISRTPFVHNKNDIFAIQHVPEDIYKANYPIRLFSINQFNDWMSRGWDVIASGEEVEGDIQKNLPFTLEYKWILLRKIEKSSKK